MLDVPPETSCLILKEAYLIKLGLITAGEKTTTTFSRTDLMFAILWCLKTMTKADSEGALTSA